MLGINMIDSVLFDIPQQQLQRKANEENESISEPKGRKELPGKTGKSKTTDDMRRRFQACGTIRFSSEQSCRAVLVTRFVTCIPRKLLFEDRLWRQARPSVVSITE